MSLSERRLLLFTKPPRPGRVKTRLIGAPPAGLTPEQAAEIHTAFVEDVLDRLRGGAFSTTIAWALDDLPAESPIPDPYGFPGMRQQGDDLGARLFAALSSPNGREGDAEARWVAALGSDHPTIPVARVEEAFARLEAGADLVLGPADDGGYYLLAARRSALSPRLFEGIAWSTETVLAETLARADELGLRVERLAVGCDCDTPADLARLAEELRAEDGGCPRTRALLERWGRFTVPAEVVR